MAVSRMPQAVSPARRSASRPLSSASRLSGPASRAVHQARSAPDAGLLQQGLPLDGIERQVWHRALTRSSSGIEAGKRLSLRSSVVTRSDSSRWRSSRRTARSRSDTCLRKSVDLRDAEGRPACSAGDPDFASRAGRMLYRPFGQPVGVGDEAPQRRRRQPDAPHRPLPPGSQERSCRSGGRLRAPPRPSRGSGARRCGAGGRRWERGRRSAAGRSE